ncbi:hypothetical protein DL96DRAFT_1579777 [Flagelloscypha sp. PMI_526]|nr:hypothetical protein DL96DRAFT_1579777 [Flagelloscypha sp. PMI_526]
MNEEDELQPLPIKPLRLLSEEPLLPRSYRKSQIESTQSSKFGRSKLHAICLAMHIVSTALYFIMILVMHFGLEKRVQVQLGPQTDSLSLFIQIFLQLFTIVFLMATLFVTQKLFMRRLLVQRQSLTQSHDQYSSWLGLVSSISILLKQLRTRAGYKWILVIMTYLTASAVMKITTAALFQLSPTNIVILKETQASSISSDFLASVMRGSPVGPDGDAVVQYLREAMVLEYARLGTWETSSTVDSVGLRGNVLYDVIPSNINATNTLDVAAITINADCKALSSKDFLSLDTYTSNNGTENVTSQIGWSLHPFSVSAPIRELNASQTISHSFLIPFQSMYRIHDSQGKALNGTPISKLLFRNSSTPIKIYINDSKLSSDNLTTYAACPSGIALRAVTPLSRYWNEYDLANNSGTGFMLCSLTWQAGSVVVDAINRTPVKNLKRKDQSSWSKISMKNLTYTPIFDDTPSQATTAPMFFLLGTPPGQKTFEFYCYTEPKVVQVFNIDWTLLDVFAAKYLGLINQTIPQVKLHDFENMLEDWVAMNMYIYDKANVLVNGASNKVSATVPTLTQVSQLQLRSLPVFGGFAASLVMLLIAITIIATTPGLQIHPTEIGVLQLLWLLDVRFDLGHPEAHPTEENLRRAGLTTSVSLINGVGAIRRSSKRI